MKKNHVEKIPQYLSEIYLAAMLSLFLLFFGPQGYENLGVMKFTCFVVLTGAFLVALLLFHGEYLLIQHRLPVPWKMIRSCLSPVHVCLLLYLFFTLLSTCLSPYGDRAWVGISRYEGFITICLYVLLCSALSVFSRPMVWNLYLLAGTVTLICLLSLIQLMGYNPLGLYPEGYNYFDGYKKYSGAFLGTIGNIDFMAAMFSAVVPAFVVALIRLKGRKKYWLLAPLLLSLLILSKMQVAAGILGCAAGVILALPVVLPVSRKKRVILALVIFLLVLCGIILLCAYPFEAGTLGEFHQILRGNISDSFGSGRIQIWRSVLELVPEHLWFGIGPDTLLAAEITPFTRITEEFGLIEVQIDTAHNEYLNILVQQGLLALLAYLAVLILLLGKWIRCARDNTVAAVCGAGILGYCVQAFFGISVCVTAPLMWIGAALLLRSAAPTWDPEKKGKKKFRNY